MLIPAHHLFGYELPHDIIYSAILSRNVSLPLGHSFYYCATMAFEASCSRSMLISFASSTILTPNFFRSASFFDPDFPPKLYLWTPQRCSYWRWPRLFQHRVSKFSLFIACIYTHQCSVRVSIFGWILKAHVATISRSDPVISSEQQ